MRTITTLFVASFFFVGYSQIASAQAISTFAGSSNPVLFSGDGGPATAAQMDNPFGVAVDTAGNLIIAETGNNLIRMISASGNIGTVSGNAYNAGYYGDGVPASTALMYIPYAVATDKVGNIYISDFENNYIRKVNAAGVITTIAGNGYFGLGGDGGPALSARLGQPTGITVDAAGNIFLADRSNHVVRKINTSGIITTVAGIGAAGFSGDGGLAILARLQQPTGVAVDAAGNIYITDAADNRIRKVNTAGIISTIAGTGVAGFSGDGGAGIAAKLYQPSGIVSDAAGNIFFSDRVNRRIREVNTAGIIFTVVGRGIKGFLGDGGPAVGAELNNVFGLALDAAGNLYLADVDNNRIRKVNTAGIITTIGGSGVTNYGDGGAALAAQIKQPVDITSDASGNIYINDQVHNRIRKVNSTGIISTYAGNGMVGHCGDGRPATNAMLNFVNGILMDGAGNLFIAEGNGDFVRKVSASGIITTIAGSESPTSGDGGPATAAFLFNPHQLAVDRSGNLYIADNGNNRVRMVNTAGIISTYAGNGISSYTGDGGAATDAGLTPSGLAFDGAGNLYIADANFVVVRKVSAAGIISTVAGNGTWGYSGDGGPATNAQMRVPLSVAVDGSGNLYIAEEVNHIIRKVSPSGIISTVAGTGTPGYTGDGGLATNAQLNAPVSAKIDHAGNIYIADFANNVIRRISEPPAPSLQTTNSVYENGNVRLFPNPANTLITVVSQDRITKLSITNISGQTIYSREYDSCIVPLNIADFAPGVYLVNINGVGVSRFVKE